MNVVGRPTSYRPEFCELACNYCLLGATNVELAGFFDVAPRTIDNWIARIPEFAAAVRDGRAVADARVARALYERAVGYTRTLQRTVLWRGQERTLERTVHYPPDIRACIFWLRNRRRQDWSAQPPPPSDEPSGIDDWWTREADERPHDPEVPSEEGGEENTSETAASGEAVRQDCIAEPRLRPLGDHAATGLAMSRGAPCVYAGTGRARWL